ncbi:transmembrane protein 238 [Menidia menidia]
MDPVKCVGSCVPVFLMAVAFDITGLVLLFVGIFADLRVDGRFYGDFLIYTGSIVVFFSLGCWLMWYLGNVRVHEEDEDGFGKRSSIVRLARKISERLTRSLKGEERKKRAGDEESVPGGGGPEPRSGRVTWGKATAYNNEGYDSSMDSPDLVKKETF